MLLEKIDNTYDVNGSQVSIFNLSEHSSDQIPLVMLHGIGRKIHNWRHLPSLIDRPVVAIDVTTDRNLGFIPSMADYGRAVMSAIDHVEINNADKLHLLGYSWGGILAQQIMLDNPGRIDKAVLAATMPGKQMGIPSFEAIMALSTPYRSSAHFRRTGPAVYGGDIRENPNLLDELGLTTDNTNYYSYLKQLGALNTIGHIHKNLHTIKNKVLIMAGEDDPIAPLENGFELSSLVLNSVLKIVKGGGHLFLITRPEESTDTINSFLDEKVKTNGKKTRVLVKSR